MVAEGYGILQPRVGVSLPSAGRSWFVRLFAGSPGIDPYTRAVSDVYQDLFHEGSFIGKGIYDVDAFERAMDGRFPENAILSHDLLESCHARSALVSDVEFYEEHPSRYNVDVDRRHRWIRGDWQIMPWLLPRVPGAEVRSANPLSGLSRWKVFDNLRRSLVPAALLLLLLGGWILLPGHGSFGLLAALAIVSLPSLLALVADGLCKPADLPWLMHWRCARVRRHASPARSFSPGVPALRRPRQPGRHRANARETPGDPKGAPPMADVERFRTGFAVGLAGFYRHHVDRSGPRPRERFA